ncbi:MAG TPA: flagellar export chaperone FliS [Aminobacterium sp.]|jgi:flagellar protein FliS|uniref:flagellar export chaperone FliS n=1 Tax=Aminobacterium TaxID=81466 RepID=UPI000EF0AA1F|nr:flagellar export chaperone FliS [Aminobacterium sp. UBA4834]HCA40759.1 flagellar export chaperone FliS [Aminobacterium sp.]
MVMNNSRNAQINQYLVTQIQTASKEQLLLITYDIGIKNCRAAELALSKGELEEANSCVLRAQEVVRELTITLDVDKGGEIAENLLSLYDFMYRQLIEGNMKKAPDIISLVRGMLEELRDTWEQAIEKIVTERSEAASVENKPSSGLTAGGFNVAG